MPSIQVMRQVTHSVDGQEVCAVEYDREYLEKSWQWLRDEEIANLTLTPAFSRQQQTAWFDSLPGRSDYFVWGIRVGPNPVGAFGIKNVAKSRGEYWGYIGEKNYWKRGIGTWMIQCALLLAASLGLNELILRVSKGNTAAIALYRRSGFTLMPGPADAQDGPDILWMRHGIASTCCE